MAKIIKRVILSASMLLYSISGVALGPPNQLGGSPIKSPEIQQAQASVAEAIASSNNQNEQNVLVNQVKHITKPTYELNDEETKKNNFLDTIRSQLWAGHYQAAEQNLAIYKQEYGEDDRYLTEKARLLALTNRSKESLTIIDPLLKKDPSSLLLLDVKQYALQHPEVPIQIHNPQADLADLSVRENPLLKLADAQSEKLQFKQAAQTFHQYLESHPHDPQVTLMYIRTEFWASNYSAGESALAAYEKQFGVDENSLTERARFLALTGNKNALPFINALLKKYPKNDFLPEIKAYALKNPYVPGKAGAGGNAKLAGGNAKSVRPQLTLAVAQRFEHAAVASNDPKLYLNAAQAYSELKQPNQAFLMIQQAVCLAPDNIEYLTMRAELANELSKPAIAVESYIRILGIKPCDRHAMLGLAQSYSAQNRLTDSANAYFDYLTLYPDDKDAWIAYAYIRDWMGDSRDALRILRIYRCFFGCTFDYLATKARVLAEAERPTPACCIIRPLLRQKPDDSGLVHTKVVAYYYNNQPVEMFRTLCRLRVLTKNDQETKDLSDFVSVPYKSNVNIDLYHSKDTDSVEIDHATVTGQIFLDPLTRILLMLKEEPLSANPGSGLAPIQGGREVIISEQTIGINKQVTPKIDLEAAIGNAHVTHGLNSFVYHAAANFKPRDGLYINFWEARDYYDVSARTVSLNITQQLNQVTINWEPCIQRYLTVQSSYSTFSDTNTMWFLDMSPKAGVYRGETLDVDLGVNGQWFGFSEQPDNGYYDPTFYQYYAATVNGYIKQSTNIGYGFSLALGQQRDETFHSFKFAGDVGVVGYFGIYKDWMLVVSAAISNRGRAIGAASNLSTNYRVWAFDAALTRRFNM